MMRATSRPLITFGIPTYNRCNTVAKRVVELLKATLPVDVEILIIDNASPDGTYSKLQELCAGSSIRLLRNEKNVGFHGNFVELIKNATGEYLLWSSDEDSLLESNLSELIAFLKEHRPYFVSTQCILEIKGRKELYRGKEQTSGLTPEDVWSQGHLPGLIFHTDTSREFFQGFEAFLTKYPTIILYYPHTMVAIHLALAGSCYWWGKPITEQIDFLPQLHQKDNQGSAYYHVRSRWTQWREFVGFLSDLTSNAMPEQRKKLDRIQRKHQERLFHLMRGAINIEMPEVLNHFDQSAEQLYGIKSLPKRIMRMMRSWLPG